MSFVPRIQSLDPRRPGVLMLMPLAMCGYFQWRYGTNHVTENLYVAVAGTIPVLLLALMVEVGRFARPRELETRLDALRTDVEAQLKDLSESEERAAQSDDLRLIADARRVLQEVNAASARVEDTRARAVSALGEIRLLVRSCFLWAAAGEAAALYAISAHVTNAGLTALAVASVFLLGILLWSLYEEAFTLAND